EGKIENTTLECGINVLVVPQIVDGRRDGRRIGLSYEETCGAEGMPATLNGLILALGADPPPWPRSLRPDAVQVTTYHGAKGLEWPLVILTGLDRESQPL